jgi:AcrR family transcriptional regulator
MLADLLELFLAEGFAQFNLEQLARRLRCSKTSLYLLAPSKEQIVVVVVRRYFKDAAVNVEGQVAAVRDPRERLTAYLQAVAQELQRVSARFFADMADFAPANEVYQANTLMAVGRVQQLVARGVSAGTWRAVNASFVAAAIAQVMTAIQRGEIGAATGLDDAEAYRQLADFVLAGLV